MISADAVSLFTELAPSLEIDTRIRWSIPQAGAAKTETRFLYLL